MIQNNQQKIIGIVGGMGPMAGVLLQKYIIEATPAVKDQDHIPVITYTNPQIPDRTASLLGPKNGDDFVVEIIKTIRVLQSAGATVIGIPCNTSHLKFENIQTAIKIPIIDMVKSVIQKIESAEKQKIGLLATNGTITGGVYQKYSSNISFLFPDKTDQAQVMNTIYGLKAGDKPNLRKIINVCETLLDSGATQIILGCTELSLIQNPLIKHNLPIIDSLRLLATNLVQFSQETTPIPVPATLKSPQCAT